jgi:excisionase family DNA binding protein
MRGETMTVKVAGLLHPHHVAEMLACTEKHVRDLIRGGDLVAIKIGKRSRRITRESVVIFLEKNRINPETFFE